MSEFKIFFQWAAALAQKDGEVYYFPDKFTRHFRETYAVPAVYRWRSVRRQPGDKKTIC